MFASFLPHSIPRFSFGRSAKGINIASVETYDIDTAPDKRTRRLKHLIKLNHVNHAVLFNERKFHNHAAHLLGSAYLLGGDPEHLNDCYEEESKDLVPWEDSPCEVSQHDWRDYLGKKEYERAYLDFFEDRLVHHGYDWKTVVHEYLFEGNEPLVNNMISGLGHPLIHLGYAYELQSPEICMEALTLTVTCYNDLHKYLDDPKYGKHPPAHETTSPLQGFAAIAADSQFDNIFTHPGGDNSSRLMNDSHLESLVLSHWNSLQITDPTQVFKETQLLSTVLLLSSPTHSTSSPKTYDFFLVHLLTTSHALRILLPLIPSNLHLPLLRQWYLIAIIMYVSQLRPSLSLDDVRTYDLKGRDWTFVEKRAIDPKNKHSTDAHYVKACRAIKVAKETWGEYVDGDVFLKAAVKFADEFEGWGGFGAEGEEQNVN